MGSFASKNLKSIKEAFPVYGQAEETKTREEMQRKNYATVALCCLSVTNPFRSKIISLVVNQWFENLVLFIVLLNCLSLALTQENEFVTKNENIID